MRTVLAVVWVLLITFVFGTAYAHVGAIPDTVRLLVIIGPAAVWLGGLIRQQRGFPQTRLDWPLAATALWLIVAALLAQDRRISLELIWAPLAHILLFYFLVDLIRRGWNLRLPLLMSALVIVLISIAELTIWSVRWTRIAGISLPPIAPHLDWALNITTIQANMIAVLFPIVITAAFMQPNRRYSLFGLSALLIGVISLTFSRGGLFGLLAGILVLFGFAARHRYWRMMLGAILILVIGISLLGVIWSARDDWKASDKGRDDIWHSALEMTQDHPLTGVGPGGFGRALRSYRDPHRAQDKISHAHNIFLNILAETGIPGLLIFLWLIVTFCRVWWRNWRQAASERRIWLEAALAAFVAYGIHSLVDTFPLTSSVLPLLILGAMVAAEPETEHVSSWRVWVGLILIAIFMAGLARLDVAQFWMVMSHRAIEQGDLETALDRADKAHSWDPSLPLYDLHRAYVLGLLANENPRYLNEAISAHEAALAEEPTFDLGWYNVAALYQQKNNGVAAREARQRAADINPTNPVYWLALNDVQRALAEDLDVASQRAAWINYSALEEDIRNPSFSVGQRLFVAVMSEQTEDLTAVVANAETEDDWIAHLALGLYWHRMGNDNVRALEWLNLAVEDRPGDMRAYMERGDVYRALGRLDDAERDARIALFIDPSDAASTKRAPMIQYVAGSVYARPAYFDYLPQADVPSLNFQLARDDEQQQGNP
jgi:putative inorganic carbon (HCO3(-)) transporter